MRRVAPLLILSLLVASGGPAMAGQTACWFENGAVIVPAAIGGLAGDYVLDLSAPRTLLHIDVAQGAGYVETPLTLPVQLAGQRVEAAPIVVQSLDFRAVGFSTPIIGVVGADILDRYVVTLDFAPCRLTLERPEATTAGQAGALRVVMVGGVPTIVAAASDGLKGVSGPFALDTASGGGVRARGAADGPRQKPAGALPDGVVGALGVEVLSAYRLRLDPKALRLWLTPKEKGPGVSAGP